ncbi:putative B3 domain-containing protein Os06g0632500 [Phragmites australis]|uniref:putative B3 domain-containing protein Os06g0632500 n=1 Tax=Phragmites australis TaxID=29695 RepID=UPI002D790406|nr:putative B3 domain-containing protein Os06g0632500 [Phragmites australis]
MARGVDHLERREFFKVLLPCCLQDLESLQTTPARRSRQPSTRRVPSKVSRVIGDSDGAVLVVGALGRVWRVEVRRGGKEEAFLARGWAEFARAHGIGVGWFAVFRHEGRGVLSVKAFDTSLCRRELCAPFDPQEHVSEAPRPQFIRIFLREFSRKMPIPPRYEGNMVFTVKVFEPSGCQKEYYGTAISGDVAGEKTPGDQPHAEEMRQRASQSCRMLPDLLLKPHATLIHNALKTSAQSKRSWKATFRTANTYCYLQSGWKEFCRDNREGDQCTINIVERTL